jgi:hypothetical protein
MPSSSCLRPRAFTTRRPNTSTREKSRSSSRSPGLRYWMTKVGLNLWWTRTWSRTSKAGRGLAPGDPGWPSQPTQRKRRPPRDDGRRSYARTRWAVHLIPSVVRPTLIDGLACAVRANVMRCTVASYAQSVNIASARRTTFGTTRVLLAALARKVRDQRIRTLARHRGVAIPVRALLVVRRPLERLAKIGVVSANVRAHLLADLRRVGIALGRDTLYDVRQRHGRVRVLRTCCHVRPFQRARVNVRRTLAMLTGSFPLSPFGPVSVAVS